MVSAKSLHLQKARRGMPATTNMDFGRGHAKAWHKGSSSLADAFSERWDAAEQAQSRGIRNV